MENIKNFNLSNSEDSLNSSELFIVQKYLTPSFFILTFNNTQAIFRHSNLMSGIFVAGYVFVFILGLLGNIFVIFVVVRFRQMRTITNFFITNLAFADILVILFCVLATLTSNIVSRKYNYTESVYFNFIFRLTFEVQLHKIYFTHFYSKPSLKTNEIY